MASLGDLRRQVMQLDREIVEMLSRRTNLMRRIVAQSEDEDSEWDEQVLAAWLEEGFDHALEEGPLEKVCKSVMDMGKKAP